MNSTIYQNKNENANNNKKNWNRNGEFQPFPRGKYRGGKTQMKKKTDNAYILDSIELHKFDMCGLWLGFACCMFVKSHVL